MSLVSSFIFIFLIYIYIYIYHHLSCTPFSFFSCFQADPKPLSVYHPTTDEISTTMHTPMEGFFDEVDIVAQAMASASITTQGVSTETPIPSQEPSPVEESA